MKHEHSDSRHVMSWWAERDVMDQAAGTERWTEAETEAWKRTGCSPLSSARSIPADEPDGKSPDWHLSLRGLGTPLDWIRTWAWSQRVLQQQQTCLCPHSWLGLGHPHKLGQRCFCSHSTQWPSEHQSGGIYIKYLDSSVIMDTTYSPGELRTKMDTFAGWCL